MKVFVSESARKPAAGQVKKAKEIVKQAEKAEVQDKAAKLKDRHVSKKQRKVHFERKFKKITTEHSNWMRTQDKAASDLQDKLTKIRDGQKDRATKFASKAQLISARINELVVGMDDLDRQISVLRQTAPPVPVLPASLPLMTMTTPMDDEETYEE